MNLEKKENEINNLLARRYFTIYETLLNQKEITDSDDPVYLLRNLVNNHYSFRGRVLTEEEIIALEIENIRSMMISTSYYESKYQNEINKSYKRLLKAKISYSRENLSLYKFDINRIYLLLKKNPPFLDEIYEKCDDVEKRIKKER